MSKLLSDPLPITVALYFRAADAPALWDLAARHRPEDEDDISTFAKAARATERGLPLVLECTVQDQVEQIGAFFVRHGIQPPRIEELRVDGS